MIEIWRKNIQANLDAIQRNQGAGVATIVSGSASDKAFWQKWFQDTRHDVLAKDGSTLVVSTHEETRKGNFLGSLYAWLKTRRVLEEQHRELPEIGLMCMVFGQGKRLSPFTQALGNRKPAFPTPRTGSARKVYLTTADIANLSSAGLMRDLNAGGFRGFLIKWGDEALIPSAPWQNAPGKYANVDAIRFVWKTEPTEQLAREKEWVVVDSQTGQMEFQLARQDLDALRSRMSGWNAPRYYTGVNLGSLAISYSFLSAACEVMRDDILSAEKWLDWDPYVWIALFCLNEQQWQAEIDHEARIGRSGIKTILARCPNFFDRICAVRTALEKKLGRPLRIGVLDYGSPFWVDWGLQTSLRRTLASLTQDSPEGIAARELFGISHDRDQNGNIVLDSSIPAGANIRNSVLLDTIITDPETIMRDGVVIGGRHKRLRMPDGGSALFCAADNFVFAGPNGIAFKSVGNDIRVEEGGRHTTLFLEQKPFHLVSNECIADYEGENYDKPILGNELSFGEAATLVAREELEALERRWLQHWSTWLR